MKKAFTLIELLVVIAIIAILAAILFPVFAQAKAAAKASANLSNLKQTGLGAIQYSADSDDVFPLVVRIEGVDGQAQAFGAPAGTNMQTTPIGAIPWLEAMFPYTKSRDIYTSPIEGGATTDTSVYRASFKKEQFYGAMPSAAAIYMSQGQTGTQYPLAGPYSQGALVDGPFGYANGATGTPYATPSKSQTSVDKVAEVIMVSDAGAYDMGLGSGAAISAGSNNMPTTFPGYAPGPYPNQQVYVGPWGRKNTSGTWNGGKSATYAQGQRGQATSCFVDGHAASQDISRVYELRNIDSTGTTKAVYRLYSGTTQ